MENLPFVPLLRVLQPLSSMINDVSAAVPSIAPRLQSEEQQGKGDEDILAVWTRESKHNYKRDANMMEVFHFT